MTRNIPTLKLGTSTSVLPAAKGASSIHSALAKLSSRLDRLQAEIQLGFRDQRHFDACEGEAQEIGKGVRGAFRGQGSIR